jgi:hypothetical protein
MAAADPQYELKVGVLTPTEDRPAWQVAVDFDARVDVISFPPEFAVHFAQLLLKNARLAGYTGPFVELPLYPAAPH